MSEKDLSKSEEDMEKIRQDCDIILEMANILRDIYAKPKFKEKKNIIEYALSAVIYWASQKKRFWSCKMSEKLIRDLKDNSNAKKGTKEHEYPRKITSHKLLNDDEFKNMPLEGFVKEFINKYGKWNLVHKSENNALKPHQNIKIYLKEGFYDPKRAYEKINPPIKLIEVTDEERKQIQKRNIIIIDKILKRNQ